MGYLEARKARIAHFNGLGLDIGPFDLPFISNPAEHGLKVETVDRWPPEKLKELFPELDDFNLPPDPDFLHNVSADGLSFSEDGRFDFTICSHVIEHVANPFELFNECYRVVKDGGALYFGVPDVRISFDKGRMPTSYAYLREKFDQGVRQPTLADLKDYFSSETISQEPWVKRCVEAGEVNEAVLAHECQRSFHVHVWTSQSFLEHMGRFAEEAGLRLRLIACSTLEENGYEGVLFVRKDLSAPVGALRAELAEAGAVC